jgi:hypothetical protein
VHCCSPGVARAYKLDRFTHVHPIERRDPFNDAPSEFELRRPLWTNTHLLQADLASTSTCR